MPDIATLVWPKTVAVFGASPDRTIIRGRIMHVLGCHPFPGKIYPISRSHEAVNGLKAYTAISEVPEPIELAILVIPAVNVPEALEECGEAGVKAALIVSSGFAEEAGEAGDALQDRIHRIAETYDMAVCGPNSEGFANVLSPLTATFSPAMDDPDTPLIPSTRTSGFIGVTAQSGGIGFSFYDRGRPKELPFSYILTTGNEASLAGLDMVDYMLDDGRTDVFIMFMEDAKDPAKLAHVAERALRAGKPIILAKIGRSDAGQRAAASHTAALTGSYSAYQAIFDRYGIIVGRDVEEMVDIAAGFSHFHDRLPTGKRVGIVTGSGGGGGWMADTCVAEGLDVPPLDAQTRATIDAYLPPFGTSQNPVDGTAQAVRRIGYGALAGMVAGSSEVDSVIVVTSARNAAGYEREQENLIRVAQESGKPILFCSYTLPRGAATELINACGYPLYTNMRNCAHAVARMAAYRAFRENFLKIPHVDTGAHAAHAEVREALAKGGPTLCEYQAKPLLAAYGVPVTDDRLVTDADAAVAAAQAFAGPVALKVQSPDILHKTEAGAVALGLHAEADIRASHDALLERARAHDATADIHGVLVQPMASRGQEIILGVSSDESFGPMLMVGLGGIHVEVLEDVVFSPVPIDATEARALLQRLKGYKILTGVRGAPPADIDALVDLIVTLARFAADHADAVREIDLNPVLVHAEGDGVSVVDALIVTEKAAN